MPIEHSIRMLWTNPKVKKNKEEILPVNTGIKQNSDLRKDLLIRPIVVNKYDDALIELFQQSGYTTVSKQILKHIRKIKEFSLQGGFLRINGNENLVSAAIGTRQKDQINITALGVEPTFRREKIGSTILHHFLQKRLLVLVSVPLHFDIIQTSSFLDYNEFEHLKDEENDSVWGRDTRVSIDEELK